MLQVTFMTSVASQASESESASIYAGSVVNKTDDLLC